MARSCTRECAKYEVLANLALLGLMFFLAYRLRRLGVLMLVYLFGYVIKQFSLFFSTRQPCGQFPQPEAGTVGLAGGALGHAETAPGLG
jgi:hypothetical protein